ncbi:MAG: hypothetical protein HY860_00245 [Chlamydiales bacterium]|nr:hypothetical protein [Chlamydiales bacterium]
MHCSSSIVEFALFISLNLDWDRFSPYNHMAIDTTDLFTSTSPRMELNTCTDDLSLPSFHYLLSAPYFLTQALVDLVTCILQQDTFGGIESGIKSCNICMSFVYVVDSLFLLIDNINTGAAACSSLAFSTTLGLVITILEGLHQVAKLFYQVGFHDHLSFSSIHWIDTTLNGSPYSKIGHDILQLQATLYHHREKIELDFGSNTFTAIDYSLYHLYLQTTLETLPEKTITEQFVELQTKVKQEFLYRDLFFLFENYCIPTSSNNNRFTSLASRVEPWCAKQITLEIKELIQHLRSDDPSEIRSAIDQGEKLLQNIDYQSKKKLIIQTLAFVAIAISITCIIGVFFLPPVAIITLIVFSSALSLARSLIATCMLPNEGFTFTPHSLLPSCFQTQSHSSKFISHANLKA